MGAKLQPHLMVKKGDVAENVLLAGDPGRVHKIAKYLDNVKKVSEYRGFITYTGEYKGLPVSVTTTGIGCPSALIVIEELVRVGAKTMIRVGSCGSLKEDIDIGDIIIATAATRTDGATTAYAPPELPAIATFEVTQALVNAASKLGINYHLGPVFCSSAFYAEDPTFAKRWGGMGVIGVEMETSALFTLSLIRNYKAGAILAVDGNLVKGTKKEEFKEGEEKGEFHPKFRKAVEDEIKVALEAIKLLSES